MTGKRVRVDDFCCMTVISSTNTCLYPDKDTSWPKDPADEGCLFMTCSMFPQTPIPSVYCQTKTIDPVLKGGIPLLAGPLDNPCHPFGVFQSVVSFLVA